MSKVQIQNSMQMSSQIHLPWILSIPLLMQSSKIWGTVPSGDTGWVNTNISAGVPASMQASPPDQRENAGEWATTWTLSWNPQIFLLDSHILGHSGLYAHHCIQSILSSCTSNLFPPKHKVIYHLLFYLILLTTSTQKIFLLGFWDLFWYYFSLSSHFIWITLLTSLSPNDP